MTQLVTSRSTWVTSSPTLELHDSLIIWSNAYKQCSNRTCQSRRLLSSPPCVCVYCCQPVLWTCRQTKAPIRNYVWGDSCCALNGLGASLLSVVSLTLWSRWGLLFSWQTAAAERKFLKSRSTGLKQCFLKISYETAGHASHFSNPTSTFKKGLITYVIN